MKSIDVEVETATVHYKTFSSSYFPTPSVRRVDKIETKRFQMTVFLDNIGGIQEIEHGKSHLWIRGKNDPICIAETYESLLKRIREASNGR